MEYDLGFFVKVGEVLLISRPLRIYINPRSINWRSILACLGDLAGSPNYRYTFPCSVSGGVLLLHAS
jgi:hypothetical protein